MTAVIINYCSNEKVFVDALLDECKKFATDIVVSYGSHLYNGQSEDEIHIESLRNQHKTVKFVKYDVDVDLPNSMRVGVIKRPTAYWHNLARWTAVQALDKQSQWVFVIDADEVPDGNLVREWLAKVEESLSPSCCYKCACYWYFKTPQNQATTLEDSILLIHKSCLTKDNIFGDDERDYLIAHSKCRLLRQVKDLDGCVMWHHYSFVRDKTRLSFKLRYWGHANDLFHNIDVDGLIEHIFRNDDVNDVVHGYTYKHVDNRFGIKFKNL